LRELILEGVSILESEWKNLESLKQITTLQLSNSSFSDQGAIYLNSLGQLKLLDLSGTCLTDTGMEKLKNLTQIQSLRLHQTNITDGAIAKSDFPNMVELDLSKTKVSGKAFGTIRSPNLRALYLSNSRISDSNIHHLLKFKKLATLDLSETNIGDQSINYLQQLKTLTHLNLSDTEVGYKALSQFSENKNLQNLQNLRISGLRITYNELTWLKSLLPGIDIRATYTIPLPSIKKRALKKILESETLQVATDSVDVVIQEPIGAGLTVSSGTNLYSGRKP
ncbi:MAG: hypothetical protein GY786_22750, partial [Proteobacteria bacterium]|nr:hypothetical protein [Pseudomonadota bacterium]